MRKWSCIFVAAGLMLAMPSTRIIADADVIENSVPGDELCCSFVDEKDNSESDQKEARQGKSSDAFLNEIRNNTVNRAVDSFDIEELQRELLKILAAHYESLKKKREDMLEKLSLQDRERIKKSEQLFQNIVEKITIPSVLFDETKAVWELGYKGVFSFLSDEKEELLKDLLSKLRKSLEDRTFIMLMRGFDGDDGSQPSSMISPDQMMNMALDFGKKPAASLTSDELERLVYFLEDLKAHFGDNVPKELQSFSALLSSIHYKKNHDLAMLVLAKIKPEFDEVFSYLKESVNAFEEVLKQDLEPSVKEAYGFWLKTIQRFYRSLWIFDSLRDGVSFGTTKFSNDLFALVTYGYDIAKGFFDLYKFDHQNNPGSLAGPIAADWAFCTALSTWQFFNTRANYLDGMLLKTLLGDLKIDVYEARQLLMFNAMAASGAFVSLFNPSFWNQKPYGLARAFHKVATAWVYYMVFDSNLFGDGSLEPWVSGSNKLDALGRRKDRHLRQALLFALQEGTFYLSSAIQRRIVYNANPMMLENLRTYSMGIIRPAMISYVLKALVPFVFLQDSHLGNPPIPMLGRVVSFDRNDLFSFDKEDRLGIASNFMKYSTNCQGFDKDEFYLEAVLLSYIGESVGSFWGRKFVQTYKSQLCTAGETVLGACGSFLEFIGWVNKGWVDEWRSLKNDVFQEFEYDLELVKVFLRTVFDVNSPMRSSVVSILVHWGDLDEDETNPFEINRKIVFVTVNFLAMWRLLTNYDATIIARKFDVDPLATEKVIDNICDALLSNLAGASGEYAGGLFGYYGAKWVLSHYGSLYGRFIKSQAPIPVPAQIPVPVHPQPIVLVPAA